MGFAHWSWRLLLLTTSIVVLAVLALTLLILARRPASPSITELWLVAAASVALGGLAVWFSVRRLVLPLSDLSQQVRSIAASADIRLPPDMEQDEVGLLTAAFERLQRDLAGRLIDVQRQSQQLESVLRNMAEGVLAAAPDTTILLANDSAKTMLDFAAANPVGRSLLEVTRARPVSEALDQALRTGRPVEMEFESPGIQRKALSLRATSLPGDPCPGVLIVLHDLTDLRRLESLRRELVANVSHELKTPLAAIKGYAETLRLGAVNDPEHNLLFIRRIEEQADRLHALILDMLQLARLESGKESFEFLDVDVGHVVRGCLEQFAAVAQTKKIELSSDLASENLLATADENALRTMVNNLIDNALKYTAEGGSVQVRVLATAATIAIEVQDNGIGIAAPELVRIFERFYRVEKARSRELGGTGLGLSIVKHLAQAHGGAVSVDSEPGRGSTFRIELPRQSANPKTRRGRLAPGLSG